MFDGDERQLLSALSLVSQAAMVGGVAWVWFKLIQRRAKVDPVAQAATVEAVVAEAKEQAQEEAVQQAVQAATRPPPPARQSRWARLYRNLDDNFSGWPVTDSSVAEVEGALPLLAFKT